MKRMLMMFATTLIALCVMGYETWTDTSTGIEWRYEVGSDGSASIKGVPMGSKGVLVVPSSVAGRRVSSIGDWAFNACFAFTSITIPEGVTSIGESAFGGCSRLTSMIIPSGVVSIGDDAFSGCSKLHDITIPSTVKSIGNDAFFMCGALEKVYVSKGDAERIRGLIVGSYYVGVGGLEDLQYVEVGASHDDPVVPEDPTADEADASHDDPIVPGDPTENFDGSSAHTFNGLVYDSGEMCGVIQVTTTKETKKGVKVSGSVILGDGKKQAIKAVTVAVDGGHLTVSSKVGKLGDLNMTIGGNGFKGTLGGMTVASANVDERTGIMSATVKVQYFDAKTGKIKSKSYKLNGITSGGEAVGNVSLKNDIKSFEAVIK